MPPLHDTLRAFTASLLHREPLIQTEIAEDEFTAEEHLQLYRNNIFISLTEALGAIYEVTQRLVGAEFFAAACHHFIPGHAPDRANLHDFGREFPEFLATYPAALPLPYLPDVARLEWLWHESFHAADAAPLHPSRLAAIPGDRHEHIVFALHPAARLVYSPYPVHRIWETCQETRSNDAGVNLDEGAAWLLIARPTRSVTIHSLDAAEWAFLDAVRQGQRLGEAVDQACDIDMQFDLGRALQRSIVRGAFADAVHS